MLHPNRLQHHHWGLHTHTGVQINRDEYFDILMIALVIAEQRII